MFERVFVDAGSYAGCQSKTRFEVEVESRLPAQDIRDDASVEVESDYLIPRQERRRDPAMRPAGGQDNNPGSFLERSSYDKEETQTASETAKEGLSMKILAYYIKSLFFPETVPSIRIYLQTKPFPKPIPQTSPTKPPSDSGEEDTMSERS